MKFIYLTLLLVSNAFFLFAQNPYLIKGSVTDTMATYKLIDATITLLNQKDSTIIDHTRANAEGSFTIKNLHPGKFILLITYPKYVDYVENFILDTLNSTKNFGGIDLILKSTLLEGVIINGKTAAITIKGDTTEYNAGSYNIQPNSKVEDLLKQLPGIQIDKDGKITAQGQTVNKVLVDGEEFFGDDPTLVTQNLRGDMIDKVQLYDKKSDQATFTGIDDGEKTKTINLKLKEDKKNGYFGTLTGGLGTSDLYQTNATVNVFKGKQKYSAYGSINNTGDRGGDFSFGGNPTGISINRNAGLHYENKWKDKYGINTNYNLGNVNSKDESNSLSINTLPGRTTTNRSDQQSNREAFNQNANATFDVRLDTSSTLKITVKGSLQNNDSSSDYNSSIQREDNSFLNKSNRTVSDVGDNKSFNTTAFWAKKLRKTGRTVSVNITQSFNQSNSSGYLNSINHFFNEQNDLDSTSTIDQLKTGKTSGSIFSTNATYTEPLAKDFSLVLNYGVNLNNNSADKKSFDKDALGNYREIDQQYSNYFKFDQLSNDGGLNFNYKKGKSIINFGARINAVDFKQFDVYADTTLKRSFINWMPQVNYNYNFSRMKSLRINYNGNTSQPSIEQIQPYRTNTDPLYIILGNPDLTPSFSHRVNLSYQSFRILTEQVLMINGSFGFTSNAISSNIYTDEAGKTTSQTINLSDHTPVNFNLNVSGGRKIKGINITIDANTSGSYNYSISNNSLNTTKYFNYSIGPSIRKYKEGFAFNITFAPSYNSSSTSSLGVPTKNDSYGANGNVYFMKRITPNLNISTDGYYQYTGKSQAFDNSQTRLIWNASINRTFLKDKSLKLALTGKDLLNQNSGFSRSVYNNTINQNNYITIQRYFMCALSWDFNKMGGL